MTDRRFVVDAPGQVLQAGRELLRRGLVEGTAGNISARRPDGTIVITPAGLDYRDMQPEDLVVVGPDGAVVSCRDGRSPSSETMLHLACYSAFPDVGAVIHSHPVHATMFAVTHRGIPACLDEFSLYVGGDVRCSAYAPSGRAEVGAAAVEALRGRGAALIANHGMVAVGPGPAQALHITSLVERAARIVWGAQALGPLVPLPAAADAAFAAAYRRDRQNPA